MNWDAFDFAVFAGMLASIAVAVVGAVVARFRANGISRAMIGTASVQLGVVIIALPMQMGSGGSAWLFRRAAVAQT